MSIRLSRNKINSYVGNVVPLWLISEKKLSEADISWSANSAAVLIRDFKNEKKFSFSHGILLTLLKEGTVTVTCEYNGKKLECAVTVTKRREVNDFSHLKPFIADLHIHTSNEHKPELFSERKTELVGELIQSCKNSGVLDCSVITDHAVVTNNRDFFEGFTKDEELKSEHMVVFPGSESEVTFIENDRFGIQHKNSGELVTLNASRFSHSYDWDTYLNAMRDCPFAVVNLAHPLIVGWDMNGIWNFKLYKNSKNKTFRKIVRFVEVWNGENEGTDFLYHYAYSQALDCGLAVSPCCVSDCHGEYKPVMRKTMLLSNEKSKEMFYDAMVNNRAYACQSGCVDLKFTVNGCIMGQTTEKSDSYEFNVAASLLKNVENAEPVLLNVISDYGEKIFSTDFDKCASFRINSDTARYFYVELVDKEGRKTTSSPVWTGRTFDDYSFMDSLLPIDKTGFTVTDENTCQDASVLVNDNPREIWSTKNGSASLVIDMKQPKTFCAIGHYAPALYRFNLKENETMAKSAACFVSRYRISVSDDGENYNEVKSGYIREFGGEEMLCFDEVTARFVRFEALSNTGAESYMKELHTEGLRIAELSVFALER